MRPDVVNNVSPRFLYLVKERQPSHQGEIVAKNVVNEKNSSILECNATESRYQVLLTNMKTAFETILAPKNIL